ncbi:SAC3 domain-containing protein 1 isoform X4 [Hippocampus comes]|uniref:SAC3 domain-containing protein 1 isoform X4 n=1 Tax=Hippocampus comes TaxID=109280 RepID=UPI00094E7D6E|nr:PREDICTED: SAC3 domain-containing protein 1 isoform X4 [Hippocampus comes]
MMTNAAAPPPCGMMHHNKGSRKWQNPGRGQGRSQSQMKENVKTPQRGDNTVPRGVCQTMCPARELHKRESQNRLHRFEMAVGTEKDRRPRADPLRAVKEYSRPAAGKDFANSADLRPPAVLLKTVCYLIDEVAASPHLHPFTEVYSFVFDRLRSVKQDMIIQRAHGPDCVAILERMENLSWLLDCYANETGPHPNQDEFQALGLLYNLGSHRAMQHIMELPAPLRRAPAIMLAISINRSFLERNPVRLLRCAHRLSFLQACALHRHVTASRKDLLLIYSHGYGSRNCRFPLDALCKLLALEKRLTSTLCQACGVEINADEQVMFSKASFSEPEQEKLCCSLYHNIVAEKEKDLTISSIINGRV